MPFAVNAPRNGPLFILEGNAPFYNRGCEAILRSTVKILEDEFGPSRFVNAHAGREDPPEPDDAGPNVIQLSDLPPRRWTPRWMVRHLRWRFFGRVRFAFEFYLPEATAVLAVGGDNYSLDYGIPRRAFSANEATLRAGRPLVIWGASVGPFDREPEFERFAAEALRRVTLICARESETVAYLARIGVETNVRQVADPAFVLDPQEPPEGDEIREIVARPCLGLNLSPLFGRYSGDPSAWQSVATECVRALLSRFDLPVVLVPHVFRGEINDDHAFLDRIRRSVDDPSGRLILVGRQYGARQLKWIISRLAAFVGARTHATIAALSTHVPTVSLGYSMKARGINRDIYGHCDWMIPSGELTPERLAATVDRLLRSAADVRNELSRIMPSYKEKARAAAKYVREVALR